MSETIDISQQLEEYMQQHPDIVEALYAFQEVQAIYLEAMQIMQEAEIAICTQKEVQP